MGIANRIANRICAIVFLTLMVAVGILGICLYEQSYYCETGDMITTINGENIGCK